MPWRERRLADGFTIELSGQKIGPGLSETDRRAIYDATALRGVCVVPGQALSDEDIFDFAASLEDEVVIDTPLEGVPFTRVLPLGNVGPDGEILPADN